MGRLTLSTVGIKSPLDIGEVAGAPAPAAEDAGDRTAALPTSSASSASGRPRPARPRGSRSPAQMPRPGGETPFYGLGPRVQTSMALDAGHARLLEEIARAAHVTVNALAVAVLQAGLPTHSDDARAAIVDERVRRVDVASARVERNVRLPVQLRARIDELVAAAREHVPRATRADLINAALARALPADAQAGAELVAGYARRLEGAAAA